MNRWIKAGVAAVVCGGLALTIAFFPPVPLGRSWSAGSTTGTSTLR